MGDKMYLKKDRLLLPYGYEFYGLLDSPVFKDAYFLFSDELGNLYVQHHGKPAQVVQRYIKTLNRDPNIADEYVRADAVVNDGN